MSWIADCGAPCAPARDLPQTREWRTPPSLVLSALHPRALWNATLAAAGSDGPIVTALARRVAQDRLGSDVSLTEDLLPLIAGPARLSVWSGSSFLLEGTLPGNGDALLTRLRVHIRAAVPPVRVQTWTFPKHGTFRLVQSDDVEDVEETIGDWKVHTIGNGSGGMITATMGSLFILSDARDFVLEAIAAPAQSSDDMAIAAGTIPVSWVDTLLRSFSSGTGSVRWHVQREGAVMRLRWIW